MNVLVHLSRGEEVGNSVTHGVMSAILLISLPAVAIYSYTKGGVLLAVGESVFIISLFLMFLASCLYHAMSYDTPGESVFIISLFLMFLASCLYHAMSYDTPHKYVMRILDHIFIYFAIAGSYTPIALYVVKGWQGWLILIVQWVMVLFGILYKSIAQKAVPKLSVLIYLCMGWAAVFFIPTIIQNTSWLFIGLIVLGGIFYSAGAWFYMQKDRPYFHFIWHLFITFASISHFIAIVFYI